MRSFLVTQLIIGLAKKYIVQGLQIPTDDSGSDNDLNLGASSMPCATTHSTF